MIPPLTVSKGLTEPHTATHASLPREQVSDDDSHVLLQACSRVYRSFPPATKGLLSGLHLLQLCALPRGECTCVGGL